jgi:gas vesicle structural protein
MEIARPQPARPRARPSAPRRAVVISQHRRVSLCETLDRVLNKGAVIAGDIVISVADIDLLYLGVNLVVTSVETMRHWNAARPTLPITSQRAEP